MVSERDDPQDAQTDAQHADAFTSFLFELPDLFSAAPIEILHATPCCAWEGQPHTVHTAPLRIITGFPTMCVATGIEPRFQCLSLSTHAKQQGGSGDQTHWAAAHLPNQ